MILLTNTCILINRKLVISYFIAVIVFLFINFIKYDNLQLLAFFEDDFFYYLETSKNFLLYGFPSVDLQTPTNGYHPLWFLIITLLQIPFKTPFAISFVITIITFISFTISFVYLQRIFFLFSKHQPTADYLSIITSSLFLIYFALGMEIILVMPLITILLYYLFNDENNPLKYGLLFNILFLSRLDTLFLILLVYVYFVFKKNNIIKNKYFYIPFILSLIYILSNVVFFDTLSPISGMAKQLKTSYWPVYSAIETVFILQRDRIIYGLIPFIFFVLNYLLIIKYSNSKYKLLFLLINTFPLIFSIFNAVFSGWYYWSWYFYIFYPSIIIFFVLLIDYKVFDRIFKIALPIASILIILFYFHISRKSNISKTLFYENAIQVLDYEKQHPGIYAMGDRAGLISYLIESPLVHLEGLVMDKQYLNTFKSSSNLKEILKKYNVDYYIANMAKKTPNGYIVEEPYKIHKYQITIKDTLDLEPVIIEDDWGWKLYIFKMK